MLSRNAWYRHFDRVDFSRHQWVMEKVIEWPSCPVEVVYFVVYIDYIILKTHHDNKIINKLFGFRH
jgi:hypothetical protein